MVTTLNFQNKILKSEIDFKTTKTLTRPLISKITETGFQSRPIETLLVILRYHRACFKLIKVAKGKGMRSSEIKLS